MSVFPTHRAGPIAGPILITAGLAQLGIGAVSKVVRVNRGRSSVKKAIVKLFNKEGGLKMAYCMGMVKVLRSDC